MLVVFVGLPGPALAGQWVMFVSVCWLCLPAIHVIASCGLLCRHAFFRRVLLRQVFAYTDEDDALDALLSRIFVFRIHSLKEFLHQLSILEHSFLIENPTTLIVVDSIPSLIEKVPDFNGHVPVLCMLGTLS